MRHGFTVNNRVLAFVLSFALTFATLPEGAFPQSQDSYNGQGAPMTADELNSLVAPIALYPDALVAQTLGAATFPDQVSAAANFVHQNPSLQGQQLMQAVDAQPWDPSVKALTQFPSVLDNLSKNLSWTSALGEAYSTQSADVMAAVQRLRAQAYAAGNLKSGSQITVVQQSPQTIVIQPTNPQVVYVPTYNPTVVYGAPYSPPGYSAGAVAATGLLAFGAGIAVGAAMSGGGCCGWSYSSWNCNWHGGAVVYGGGAYYGNNAWHGGYYGSSAYGPNGSAHYSQGYNPSTGTYARGGSVSTPYGTSGAAQAYNPNTGAYAQTHQTQTANGSYGNTEVSKNGQTAYGQHSTNANGTTTGSVTSSNGGQAYGATGKNGNSAAYGESANGNKYATANGNEYKNTGSGWEKNNNGTWSNVQKPSSGSYGSNSSESRGWGGSNESSHSGSSAFGGSSSGWESRADSARGSYSRGGGGGWGGGGGGGRRR
ncbi:MAG: DUF3300 domain-containing protein [Silvibacterium sp.]|nr:DUF3300 domain-containing protein [Silvibacterium sp.]